MYYHQKTQAGFTHTLTMPLRMFVQWVRIHAKALQKKVLTPQSGSMRMRTTASLVSGFTLIETMVAITILVVAVAAPLTLASQSLFAAFYAKDQTTAFYLAQEAIEMVRNKRDHNMLQFLNGQDTQWLDTIPMDSSFWIDIPNDTMTVCTTNCLDSKLRHDGIFYNYDAGTTTRFGRSVLVTQNPSLPNEAVIAVTIEWQTGSFRERTFTLRERIYNWVPEQQ